MVANRQIGPADGGDAQAAVDELDLRILRELTADGRLSWSDLSERVGLTLTPTLRRVRRLEATGLIRGYTALLDESRLRGKMIVFISVTLERQIGDVLEEFERNVSSLVEVMSGFLMTGSADYLLRAVVRDLDHYLALLQTITRIRGVAHIQSSFALKPFIDRSAPVL